MPLSIQGRPGEARAFEVIEAFLDAGGQFIDTANVYCLDDSDIGHNERLIARALDRLGRRSAAVVATKGGLRRPKGDWVVDGDPAFLRLSCERSLKDLGVERIALYQLHAIDANLGLMPSLEGLVRLREEGKIEHIGLSNIDQRSLAAALAQVPIASVQNRCNPFEQGDFASGLVDFCGAQGVAYIPHSPVGGHYGHARLSQSELFERLAQKHGVSRYCVALAWLLAKGGHILPIPGASKPASIADSMRALKVVLDPEDVAAIDRIPGAR
jgi:aryl-alcohol dehydrogenase-like predicted oxidoreductase